MKAACQVQIKSTVLDCTHSKCDLLHLLCVCHFDTKTHLEFYALNEKETSLPSNDIIIFYFNRCQDIIMVAVIKT